MPLDSRKTSFLFFPAMVPKVPTVPEPGTFRRSNGVRVTGFASLVVPTTSWPLAWMSPKARRKISPTCRACGVSMPGAGRAMDELMSAGTVNLPPTPNVGSSRPLVVKAATAVCGDPPALVVPMAKICPVPCTSMASASSSPPKLAVASPAVPKPLSSDPSPLTRTMPKCPSVVRLAIRICPLGWTAKPSV